MDFKWRLVIMTQLNPAGRLCNYILEVKKNLNNNNNNNNDDIYKCWLKQKLYAEMSAHEQYLNCLLHLQ